MDIGKKLSNLRKSNGLTQPQLGELLNIKYKTLAAWECGRNEPDLKSLKKLAEYYDVSVDYLLSDEEGEFVKTSSEHNKALANKCINLLDDIIQVASSDTSRGGNEVMVSLHYLIDWLKTLTLQVLIENETMKHPEKITLTELDRPVSFYYQKTVFALKEFMQDLMQRNINFLLKKQETEPLTIKDMVDSVNLPIEYSKIEKMTSELDTDSGSDKK